MHRPQIIFIHGGTVFDTREKYYRYLSNKEYNPFEVRKKYWQYLHEHLDKNVLLLNPQMPAHQDADYTAWKIWFEKLFPYLSDDPIILVGHSLGTIFLVKYLSENTFPKPIRSLHLVGSVFDGEDIEVEDIGNFALETKKIQNVGKQVDQIHFWHSHDDTCCPWREVEKYLAFFPDALLHEFTDRGHFRQEEFPELLEQLKKEIL